MIKVRRVEQKQDDRVSVGGRAGMRHGEVMSVDACRGSKGLVSTQARLELYL